MWPCVFVRVKNIQVHVRVLGFTAPESPRVCRGLQLRAVALAPKPWKLLFACWTVATQWHWGIFEILNFP